MLLTAAAAVAPQDLELVVPEVFQKLRRTHGLAGRLPFLELWRISAQGRGGPIDDVRRGLGESRRRHAEHRKQKRQQLHLTSSMWNRSLAADRTMGVRALSLSR